MLLITSWPGFPMGSAMASKSFMEYCGQHSLTSIDSRPPHLKDMPSFSKQHMQHAPELWRVQMTRWAPV